jgi:hypothetical protein
MDKNYQSLKLEGAKADLAIDCMRKEQLLPSKALVTGSTKSTVSVDQRGEVDVTIKGDAAASKIYEEGLDIRPAADGKPADAWTPEVRVVGPPAERMRKKAISCASKGLAAFKP